MTHRYGPYPFGDKTEYEVAYISASGHRIYQCLSSEFKEKGYALESGWIEPQTTNNFFVIHGGREAGRVDIDTRITKPTDSLSVTVFAPTKEAITPLAAAMEQCKQALEPGALGVMVRNVAWKG